MPSSSDTRPNDHIGKDFWGHPAAAADLLNTLIPQSGLDIGLPRMYRSELVDPVPGLELQSKGSADTRRVDFLYQLRSPAQGRVVGVVHLEVQDRIEDNMGARCADYRHRLSEHLRKTQQVGIEGMPVPICQLLVHTGRGAWPTAQQPLCPSRGGAGWLRYQLVPLLDLGRYGDAEWAAMSPETETETFTCLTLLHRDVKRLDLGRAGLSADYEGPLQKLFQQLYNLSRARGWLNADLDGTVLRWIVGSIVPPEIRSRWNSLQTLEDLAMSGQALTAEIDDVLDRVRLGGRDEGRDEGREEGRDEGREEERRKSLLKVAGPYLDERTLTRCRAALEHRALPDLPDLEEVLGIPTGPDVARQLERVLLGADYVEPGNGQP